MRYHQLEVKSIALTSRISARGQITIPKTVLKTLGASPGDLIAYEVEGDIVTLMRAGAFDAVCHAALSQTLCEWATAKDEEAFGKL